MRRTNPNRSTVAARLIQFGHDLVKFHNSRRPWRCRSCGQQRRSDIAGPHSFGQERVRQHWAARFQRRTKFGNYAIPVSDQHRFAAGGEPNIFA